MALDMTADCTIICLPSLGDSKTFIYTCTLGITNVNDHTSVYNIILMAALYRHWFWHFNELYFVVLAMLKCFNILSVDPIRQGHMYMYFI